MSHLFWFLVIAIVFKEATGKAIGDTSPVLTVVAFLVAFGADYLQAADSGARQ